MKRFACIFLSSGSSLSQSEAAHLPLGSVENFHCWKQQGRQQHSLISHQARKEKCKLLANSTPVKFPGTADVQRMSTHLCSLSFLAAECRIDSAELLRDPFFLKFGFLSLAPREKESSDIF